MGRIRSLKPETPHSESLGRCSREARLLFLLLFTLYDDEGRARGNSRMLASLLYPYDDDAPAQINGWLRELEAEGSVVRYQAAGEWYICCPKWLIHQKIDHPGKSKHPAPPSEILANFREPSRIVAPDLGSRIKEGTKDKDQGGDQGSTAAPSARKPKPRTQIGDFQPDGQEALKFWESLGRPEIELALQVNQFRDHHRSHGTTMADWPAAWRTWYRNAVKFNRKETGHGRTAAHKPSAHENFAAGAIELLRERQSDLGKGRGDPGEAE